MRGEINCKAPGLQLLRDKAMEKLRSWPIHEFLHMKREWNQSADRLASATLQRKKGTIITSGQDFQNLISLNRLDELLTPKCVDRVAKMAAVTRSADKRRWQPGASQIIWSQVGVVQYARRLHWTVEWVLCGVSMVVGDRRSKDLITIEDRRFNHDLRIWL